MARQTAEHRRIAMRFPSGEGWKKWGPYLNPSCAMFLVSGEDKAMALRAVVEGRHEPEQVPAQLIRPEGGKLVWLFDQAAGRLLNRAGRQTTEDRS
jgi:hypothetical protein